MNRTEHVLEIGDVRIFAETFGDPDHPPILLIMGQMASMLWWPEAFCRSLAETGRYVIRYDNRDVGLSTHYPAGDPPYSQRDMADDAIAVLDRLGVRAAHVVGMSLGGMIAQIVGLEHPERVLSLAVMSSSPLGIDTSALPQTSDAYMAHAAAGAEVDWSVREQAVDFVAKDLAMIAGTRHRHDAAKARAFIESDYDRSGGYLSATNHFILNGGTSEKALSQLAARVLVLHGTSDPLFPVAHGAALAEAVPDGRLVTIKGGGHEIHEDDWPLFIDAIADHTA